MTPPGCRDWKVDYIDRSVDRVGHVEVSQAEDVHEALRAADVALKEAVGVGGYLIIGLKRVLTPEEISDSQPTI